MKVYLEKQGGSTFFTGYYGFLGLRYFETGERLYK